MSAVHFPSPPPAQDAPAGASHPQPERPRNTVGLVALVSGIFAIALESFVTILSTLLDTVEMFGGSMVNEYPGLTVMVVVAFVLGILVALTAITLGGVGLAKARKGGQPVGAAVAGLTLGIVFFVVMATSFIASGMVEAIYF